MEEEFKKVKLLCVNCHRLETEEEDKKSMLVRKATGITPYESKTRLKMMKIVNSEKLLRGCCLKCKLPVTETNFRCFDFDHRNPSEKIMSVSVMANSFKSKKIVAEMKKCDLLCGRCHLLKTIDKGEAGYHGQGRKRKLDEFIGNK